LSFLLDTNVISEIQRGDRCHQSVRSWWSRAEVSEVYLSVLVVGEIQRGIERLAPGDPGRARQFQSWLESIIRGFDGRLLDVDLEVARIWGKLSANRTLPLVDGLLAATAVAHDLILVTRNTTDIRGTDARCLNPFED
jgi:predicted nucleic acid-binding protein